MKQVARITGTILLAGLAILAMIEAVRFTLIGYIFYSSPLGCLAILLALSAGAIHFPSCWRPTFFGFMGLVLIGFIGFAAGWPLVGIFISGPIGSVVGTIGGVFVGISANKNRHTELLAKENEDKVKCPKCKKWDVEKLYLQDFSYGYYCYNCNQSLKTMPSFIGGRPTQSTAKKIPDLLIICLAPVFFFIALLLTYSIITFIAGILK
jgi:hypothetical protein